MAPKHKFTRGEMVAAALQLVAQSGVEALTAKALATELGTSTQPVFTCFGTMEALRTDVTDAAEARFDSYVTRGLSDDIPFFGFGKQYIRFAKEWPALYRLLFLSSEKKNGALCVMERAKETVLPSLMRIYRLDRADADRYFRDVWLAVHGIATLIVTDSCPYSAREIEQILTGISVSVCKALKEIPGYTDGAFNRDAVFRALTQEHANRSAE